MQNFRTLEIAKDFYQQSKNVELPPTLKNQFQRASSSIVLNLAEGSGKLTKRDKRKFYAISLGSLRESKVILEIEGINQFDRIIDKLGAHIWKLIQSQDPDR